MERKEAYEQIKKLGLQEECKKQFGKNFTQCKNDELKVIINAAKLEEMLNTKLNKLRTKDKAAPKTVTKTEEPKDSFNKLLAILRKRHILLESDVKEILG